MQDYPEIELSGERNVICDWIWNNLVPDSGQADNVQGELLRAIARLQSEAFRNGNINWGPGFEILACYVRETLSNEPSFSSQDRIQILADTERLANFIFPTELKSKADAPKLPCVDEEVYRRLIDFTIAFCRAHPKPISRRINPDLHR